MKKLSSVLWNRSPVFSSHSDGARSPRRLLPADGAGGGRGGRHRGSHQAEAEAGRPVMQRPPHQDQPADAHRRRSPGSVQPTALQQRLVKHGRHAATVPHYKAKALTFSQAKESPSCFTLTGKILPNTWTGEGDVTMTTYYGH